MVVISFRTNKDMNNFINEIIPRVEPNLKWFKGYKTLIVEYDLHCLFNNLDKIYNINKVVYTIAGKW